MVCFEMHGLNPAYEDFIRIYWADATLNFDQMRGAADIDELKNLLEGNKGISLTFHEEKRQIELKGMNGLEYSINEVPLKDTGILLPTKGPFKLKIGELRFMIEVKDHLPSD